MNPIFDKFVNQRKNRRILQLDLFDPQCAVEVQSDVDRSGTNHSVIYRDGSFTEVPDISASCFSLKALRQSSAQAPHVLTAHGGDPLSVMSVVNRNIHNMDFAKLRESISASRESKKTE